MDDFMKEGLKRALIRFAEKQRRDGMRHMDEEISQRILTFGLNASPLEIQRELDSIDAFESGEFDRIEDVHLGRVVDDVFPKEEH